MTCGSGKVFTEGCVPANRAGGVYIRCGATVEAVKST